MTIQEAMLIFSASIIHLEDSYISKRNVLKYTAPKGDSFIYKSMYDGCSSLLQGYGWTIQHANKYGVKTAIACVDHESGGVYIKRMAPYMMLSSIMHEMAHIYTPDEVDKRIGSTLKELIAESASCLVLLALGLSPVIDEHIRYISAWVPYNPLNHFLEHANTIEFIAQNIKDDLDDRGFLSYNERMLLNEG